MLYKGRGRGARLGIKQPHATIPDAAKMPRLRKVLPTG